MFDCGPLEVTEDQLEHIASKMDWEDQPTDPSSDSDIPAGYTLLGQFITHDLTFSTTPLGDKSTLPAGLSSSSDSKQPSERSPQLDLDCLYERSPRLAYTPPRDEDDTALMRYWRPKKPGQPDDLTRYGELKGPNDLVSYPDERAIIGDIRNDDNVLISQLHLAFLKLHNQFVGYVRRKRKDVPEERVFDEARRLCTWHYQWVIVNDYLPRIVGRKTVDSILAWDSPGHPAFDLRLYTERYIGPPAIPFEFSAAAFRFGHSMIRSHYRVNAAGIEYPLFGASKDDYRHLGGGRRLPAMLEIDWTRFFFERPPREETKDVSVEELGALSSASQPIDVPLPEEPVGESLLKLKAAAAEARARAEKAEAMAEEAEAKAGQVRVEAGVAGATVTAIGSMAYADEARAQAVKARAQAVKARAQAVEAQAVVDLEEFSKFPGVFARKIDSHLTQILATLPDIVIPPDDRSSTRSLALRDLERGVKLGLPSGQCVAREVQAKLKGTGMDDFPILSNADLGVGDIGLNEDGAPLWFYLLKEAEILVDGEKLGPVGGRIVAEVILGVLQSDEESYVHDPEFRPVIESRARVGRLSMADLLRFAGATRRNHED